MFNAKTPLGHSHSKTYYIPPETIVGNARENCFPDFAASFNCSLNAVTVIALLDLHFIQRSRNLVIFGRLCYPAFFLRVCKKRYITLLDDNPKIKKLLCFGSILLRMRRNSRIVAASVLESQILHELDAPYSQTCDLDVCAC